MRPYYEDPVLTLYQGDVREVLRALPAESVHCVVTSPPYWGLRTYGVDGQLGLEATPAEHVTAMVEVFREVRRVLRKDGTCWMNYGDSYANAQPRIAYGDQGSRGKGVTEGDRSISRDWSVWNLKQKDLVGMAWRVAFALQADGWWLRQDIIWAKPNPMPESVTDRCTKAHEYVFLLSKEDRYYYDADAIREPSTGAIRDQIEARASRGGGQGTGEMSYPVAHRNKRSVWTVPTAPFPEAHFATFPPDLVKPCILAGTSEAGCCAECGAPRERVTHVGHTEAGNGNNNMARKGTAYGPTLSARPYETRKLKHVTTTGWRSTCAHESPSVPCVVIDPFMGSGTTGMVARSLGRRAIGIDLNPEYLAMAVKRNGSALPMFLGETS